MKTLLTTAAVTATFVLSLPAHATTMETCKLAASQMSKSLPLRKDNITVIRSVGCVASNPKNRFVHIVDVTAPLEVMRQIDLNAEIKPSVLMTYCTDPQIRITLDAFDMEYRYYTQQGRFAGSFLMKASECR